MSLQNLAEPTGEVFSGRFFLVSYLPTYAAAVFILVLIWAGAPGTVQFDQAWHTAAKLGVGEIILIAIAIILGALLVHPLQLPMVRMLEGYWPRWLRTLGWPLRRLHTWRRSRLANRAELNEPEPSEAAIQRAGAAGTQLRLRYPDTDQVLPTSLGNVLAAMEARAGRAYGWDAVVAWPRLYPVLSTGIRDVVDDRRNTLDTCARMTVTFGATTIIAAALLGGSGWWLLLFVPLGITMAAYLGAVYAAVAYGEAVEAAFDLHRFDLLKVLHLPLPDDRKAEKAANEALCDLWRQGSPILLTYQHDQPSRG
jgi:hypothetical protein